MELVFIVALAVLPISVVYWACTAPYRTRDRAVRQLREGSLAFVQSWEGVLYSTADASLVACVGVDHAGAEDSLPYLHALYRTDDGRFFEVEVCYLTGRQPDFKLRPVSASLVTLWLERRCPPREVAALRELAAG